MIPLFESVGYQLIYHTFSEKCEYIKFKFRLRPSMFFLFFLAPAGIAKNPQHYPPPGCANFLTTYKFVNDNIRLKWSSMKSQTIQTM